MCGVAVQLGETGIDGLYLSSKYLRSSIKLRGEVTGTHLVFVCLDDSLAPLLATQPELPAGVSFMRLETHLPFRLSLLSLKRYSAFLALELTPLLRHLYGSDELQLVLVGRQFRGVLAVYVASCFPLFAGALSIAGSFWWKPQRKSSWEWLAGELATGHLATRFTASNLPTSSGCPTKVCLVCSDGETPDRPRGVPTTLLANQHLRDVLMAKGCTVRFISHSAPVTPPSDLIMALNWFY